MASDYYYTREGQRLGPVSGDEIKRLAVSGNLSPTDLIWKEGMASWVEAAKVKGLFGATATVPPAIPATTESVATATTPATASDRPITTPMSAQVDPSEAARIMGRHAKDAAIAAGSDALKAFKAMLKNPVGGLREAFDYLGPQRAMNVGIVFAAIFDVLFVLGIRLFVGGVAHAMATEGAARAAAGHLLGSSGLHIGIGAYGKLAVLGLVPIASAVGGFAGVRIFFRGKGSIQGDVFLAGASLLPCAAGALLVGVLGLENAEAFPAIGVFAITTTVLMTYSGCTTVQSSAQAAATLAVPLMLLIDLYACDAFLKYLF